MLTVFVIMSFLGQSSVKVTCFVGGGGGGGGHGAGGPDPPEKSPKIRVSYQYLSGSPEKS